MVEGIELRREGESVLTAEIRQYWDRRPCNLRHSPEPLGTRKYFEQVEARKYRVEPHIPEFAEFARWKGKRVLEIGCGLGTDTISFARAGAQVVAVDLSPRSIELARRRAEVFGLEGSIQFLEANAEWLDQHLPPQTFDLIYAFGSIHHMHDPEQVLQVLRLYAGPETRLKMMVYHRLSWKVLALLLGWRPWHGGGIDRCVARGSEAQADCPVTRTYTRRTVRAFLASSGWTVDDDFVDHIFPYDVSEYRAYRYRKVPWFRWMPTRWFRALERKLGWHLCVNARRS